MNNRKRVRAFTKKELENFSGVIGITDSRSNLKNNYVLFQKEMNTVLIISIKDMC